MATLPEYPALTPVGEIDPFTGLTIKSRETKTVPGYTPDYNALLQGDPLLGQFRADLSAQDISEAAQAAARAQQAFIGFGEVPNLPQGLFDPIFGTASDTATSQLASKNTEEGLSLLARIQKQRADVQQRIIDQLTGRGILRSGETGYQLGQNGLAYKQAQFDARQKLMDYLNGILQQVTSARGERQRDLASELTAAFQRQLALPTGQARPEYSYYETQYGVPPSTTENFGWMSFLKSLFGQEEAAPISTPTTWPTSPPPSPSPIYPTPDPTNPYSIQAPSNILYPTLPTSITPDPYKPIAYRRF